MDCATSSYCYHPLSPGPDTIRLLRLLPYEDENAPIQCQLFNYALQESGKRTHPYDALSYVWGNSETPKSIFIDKHNLPVTLNLHRALWRLRHRFIERILWVDALCINQGDLSEKEQQIRFMAKIYAQANRVVVWLGEAADDSDQALEEIRVAGGGEKSSNSSSPEMIQRTVLALLQRPWFRRIWILQEIAAARHILIMCGPAEIDGYAFCLGIDSLKLYKADPDLQSLIYSITYLIKGAIFRPGYIMSLGRSSLGICPLGELIDMYHTHEATQRYDKVYALLGMSSDDLSKACLSPSYRVSWEELFQNLVRFLLYPEISVEALGHKQTALIKSKGCILGKVFLLHNDIAWNNSQSKEVVFKNTSSPYTPGWSTHWTLYHSAKSIRDDDLVCILQGASRPTIIRLCDDHFDIIMIAASPPEKILELSQSIQAFPRDFLLIWDWEKPPEELHNEGICGASLRRNNWASEHFKTEFEGYLEEATRLWNIAMILEDSEDSAEDIIQEVIEHYEIAAKRGYGEILKQQLETRLIDIDAKSKDGRAVLSWAAGKGNEGAVKLLVETGKADINAKDRKGRTALSWAAGEGHEGTVKLLVETGNADIDTADAEGRTALSWAAEAGHEGVVGMLIETGEAELSSKDVYGRTPLFRAAERVHEGTVKLLLETGQADVDAKDGVGNTALSWATIFRHEGIMKLLVETGNAVVSPRSVEQI